jgi:hypothetical protein
MVDMLFEYVTQQLSWKDVQCGSGPPEAAIFTESRQRAVVCAGSWGRRQLHHHIRSSTAIPMQPPRTGAQR